MTYMEGAKNVSASFVRLKGERASWGVSAQLMDYGKIKQTTAYNEDLGNFSARDIAIGGTFAYELTDYISGGITAKFITSTIADYNSLAVGVDLGLNYLDAAKGWSISAVARNMGGQIKAYDDEFEMSVQEKYEGLNMSAVTKSVADSSFLLAGKCDKGRLFFEKDIKLKNRTWMYLRVEFPQELTWVVDPLLHYLKDYQPFPI